MQMPNGATRHELGCHISAACGIAVEHQLLLCNGTRININPLNAVSVYIRSKITFAYRGERIYMLAIISATGQTLPILWHA